MRLFDRAAFDRLSSLGDRLRKGLAEAAEAAGEPAMVTGSASIAGLFHMSGSGETFRDIVRARMDNPDAGRKAEHFFHHMLNNGVLMGAPGFFVLSTALTEADIDHVIHEAHVAFSTYKKAAA
jgi:glutamate-1-semialdehyde aminotransferase